MTTPIAVQKGLRKGHYYQSRSCPSLLVHILLMKRYSVKVVGLDNKLFPYWYHIDDFKELFKEYNP